MNALIGRCKKQMGLMEMVQFAAMVNPLPWKHRLPSNMLSSLTIPRCICLHIRLRPEWHQRCSLLTCMDRQRTICWQHSIPFMVLARDRRRVTRARRITRSLILRLMLHSRMYHPSDMSHLLYSLVSLVVPRKGDPFSHRAMYCVMLP